MFDPIIGPTVVDVIHPVACFVFAFYLTASGLLGGLGAWVLYKTRRG